MRDGAFARGGGTHLRWFSELLQKIDPASPQVINDSKTPSGRVHVGALRGVLLHDAIYRLLRERNTPVRYLFGVDDFDPLDELPAGYQEYYQPYLGAPLCNVPAPPGSGAPDMAEHFIGEFFALFQELGVGAETYRMRDVYRSGRFNEAIDRILRGAAEVRVAYREVSGSGRPDDWYPFQVICEQCGRIGTTEVYEYDGHSVAYRCLPTLVTWARGCGYAGRVSPFDGRGKLPWKLEWVAKWATFPVTIEGAGKDHMTRGGSYDVSARCLRDLFGLEPPAAVAYEFFLVGGRKMSSSRGIGRSAREIADLLPPEVLRFLVLRTYPSRPVNFSVEEEFIVKLFNDFDRYLHRAHHDPRATDEERSVYRLSEVRPEGPYYTVSFPLLLALLQLPHLDLLREVEKRKGSPLTELELRHLEARVRTARTWVEHYAEEEELLRLQPDLPARAQELGAAQRAFLHLLAEELADAPWEDDALQHRIFEAARAIPLEAGEAFRALYRVLLDRDSGPRAGSLLSFLDRDFVLRRLGELPCSPHDVWRETHRTLEDIASWISREAPRAVASGAHLRKLQATAGEPTLAALEVWVENSDGRRQFRRHVLSGPPNSSEEVAEAVLAELRSSSGLAIPLQAAA